MKTKILYRLVIVSALTSMMFACKKSATDTSANMSDADLQTQSDDQTRVSNETDAAFDDVNLAMNDQATVTGSSDAPAVRYGVAVTGVDTVKKSPVCEAIVTIDTTNAIHKLQIIYNGKGGCGINRKRTGTITVTIPAGVRWKDKGAQITVAFDLTITRNSDNKTIKLTGTHVYTNVTGGNVFALNANSTTPIIHTVTSDNMAITFDNGTQRTWHIARQRSYSYSSGLVVALSGTHTEGTTSNISEWGTNRFGNSFTTTIDQPLTVKQSCGFQLTSGMSTLTNSVGKTSITFGLDATGNATSCPINGAVYYFKLVFTGNAGRSYTFILPY
ncbi:MAG: hypothetical protein JST68_16395 [Bacteroidetes bacterium]|nr:hypothetical protein [Bacteroidota bacterium]